MLFSNKLAKVWRCRRTVGDHYRDHLQREYPIKNKNRILALAALKWQTVNINLAPLILTLISLAVNSRRIDPNLPKGSSYPSKFRSKTKPLILICIMYSILAISLRRNKDLRIGVAKHCRNYKRKVATHNIYIMNLSRY